MKCSLEPRKRKYIDGYRFLSFARKYGDKYGKKLMDTARKTGIDPAKTASKRVPQKPAEARRDLIESKIADKITSVRKSKNKEQEDETNETEEIYIPPEKRQQIIDALSFFKHIIKMEYQKVTNLLGKILDKMPKLIIKNYNGS